MPKIVDHGARREQIIDATWDLIVAGGLEAATMREIAKRAGLANGGLKHYFSGKDEIVQMAFERALNRIRRGRASSGNRGVLAEFRTLSEAAMPLDADRITAGHVLVAYWEMCLASASMAETYRSHLAWWREQLCALLRDGREEGVITSTASDEDLADELVLLTAGANVMTLLNASVVTPASLQSHLDRYIDRLQVE